MYWNLLCKINPNYSPVLLLYGEYISLIKNYPQVGKEYLDKALLLNNQGVRNSINEDIKRSEVLFSEEAVVIHISGNRESSGRILKVS